MTAPCDTETTAWKQERIENGVESVRTEGVSAACDPALPLYQLAREAGASADGTDMMPALGLVWMLDGASS